jgi:hypothetical protein
MNAERTADHHYEFLGEGIHRIMLRLPRTLLSPAIARQYCVDGQVGMSTTPDSVILELTSEDQSGDWDEAAEDSPSAVAGLRAELAAGDMRPLYLAWLSAYGTWERDEDAFDDDHEDELEPPVPAGLGALTPPQRALADLLRLDPDLLDVAAQASPPLTEAEGDGRDLAAHIGGLSVGEKDRLLLLLAQDQATRALTELLRGFAGNLDERPGTRPRRTVAELLDAAAELRVLPMTRLLLP